MNALTVVLALLAAFTNAAASVLMRRAATETTHGGRSGGAAHDGSGDRETDGAAPAGPGGAGGGTRRPAGTAVDAVPGRPTGRRGAGTVAGSGNTGTAEDGGDVGAGGSGDVGPAGCGGGPGAERPGGTGDAGARGGGDTGGRRPGSTVPDAPDGRGTGHLGAGTAGGGGGPGSGAPGTSMDGAGRSSRAVRGRRRRFWVGGAALLGGSAVLQAAALAVGSLSLVQPLMATELLFTLAIGSIVFRRRPDRITWLSFLALAVGLALFLGAAAPAAGRTTADGARWIPVGAAVLCAVLVLTGVARLVRGAPRAAVVGLASAIMFAVTAALLKEVTGLYPRGLAELAADWTPYATAFTGLVAFGLLQLAFRAGTLVASQPALTLGDALTSVALGWALFGEHIALGVRMLPEAAGVGLLAAGTVGLARAPAVSGKWDVVPAPDPSRDRGKAGAESS